MKECICGTFPATVMTFGNQMICRVCFNKIKICQWDKFTLKIISNAGLSVYKIYWVGGFKSVYVIGTTIEGALKSNGYTGFALYCVDRYEIIRNELNA